MSDSDKILNPTLQTNTVDNSSSISGGTIALLVIGLLLLAAAITFLILWLVKKDKGRKPKIPDESVVVSSNTSVTVNWDPNNTATDKNDHINLFATTDPKYRVDNGIVKSSNGSPVTGITGISPSSGTRTISGLGSNEKTFIVTTITGNDTNSSTVGTNLVYTQTDPPTDSKFNIEPLGINGFFGFELSNDPMDNKSDIFNVYSSGTTGIGSNTVCGTGNSSWNFKPFVFNTTKAPNTSLIGTLNSTCDGNDYILVANNNSLMATSLGTTGTTGTTGTNNSSWVYSNNHWCIPDNNGNATSNCIIINEQMSTNTPIPVSLGSLPKNPQFIKSSDSEQRWANVKINN